MSSDAISFFPEALAKGRESELQGRATLVKQTDGRPSPEDLLLLDVGRGSREALSSLYRELARTVYRVAARVLCDDGEAEDLVHDVFLAVQRNAASFDPSKGSARTWILCMTTNRALTRRASLNTRKHYHSDEFVESQFQSAKAMTQEQASVDRMTAQRMMEMLPEVLSAEQHRVLELHFRRGLTFREVAEELGMPLDTVRKHYYRGCERLRVHILQQKDPNRA